VAGFIGFIKGLFRSKPKAEAAELPATDAPQPQNKAGVYYLSPDDARTYGNVEYMRSVKSIRRTFSKKKVGEDNEMIRTISALEMQKAMQNGQAVPLQPMSKPMSNGTANGATNGSANNGSAPAPKAAETPTNTERRRADDSMDMFRNMARDLKKR
jgi:hypothetical protein